MEEDIYDRQKSLDLTIPQRVGIVGVGGVGSWVAKFFALVGVPEVILVDPDTIEGTNLNRTPFFLDHIGKKKVDAMAELIDLHRGTSVLITAIPTTIEEAVDGDILNEDEIQNTIWIDCRDETDDIGNHIPYNTPFTGGYDGHRVTLHKNPSLDSVFGDAEAPVRYTVTPSYVVPPVLIAVLTVNNVCNERFHAADEESAKKERIGYFDMRNISDLLFQASDAVVLGESEGN